MHFLKTWVGPVIAGFLVASIIMLFFEWINSFLFPIPDSHEGMTLDQLHALTATLPWTAYILVFLGWAFGAFEGGCTCAWFAKESQMRATLILSVLLAFAGIADMLMIGFPPVAMLLGILILAVSPYLGLRALNAFENKKRSIIDRPSEGRQR